MRNSKLYIMDYNYKYVGSVEKLDNGYRTVFDGKDEITGRSPGIMHDVIPEPTQFPEANFVLEYYGMDEYDPWELFKRCNGIKLSRDIWFMAEPVGDVWIPLIAGMQTDCEDLHLVIKKGDTFRVGLDGHVVMDASNQRTFDLLPECVLPYLRIDFDSYSMPEGYVHDLIETPATRGIVGRIVVNFNNKKRR